MQLLGYSDIRLTLGTYSQVEVALTQEAANAIDKLFGASN
jgi:hypothetical protein